MIKVVRMNDLKKREEIFKMKSTFKVLGIILLLALALADCSGKKDAAAGAFPKY